MSNLRQDIRDSLSPEDTLALRRIAPAHPTTVFCESAAHLVARYPATDSVEQIENPVAAPAHPCAP